ncbi:hypothetical protein L6164_037566 [Bauhinia variegata]|uniref:Uncharacterized protein n=1 Tax=Bauhinia variegata TaxID=167791 RepID=A0ACB9KKL2_BAUVA|nr:hypothetical protein L6164_037566 [Bauhinia variegata]
MNDQPRIEWGRALEGSVGLEVEDRLRLLDPNPKIPHALASPELCSKVVMDTGPSTWPFGQAPPAGARAPKIEEGERAIPQTRTHKPPHPTGEEYLNWFTRNASLVASGVVKNLNKVGNYRKESLDDILYPYRRIVWTSRPSELEPPT